MLVAFALLAALDGGCSIIFVKPPRADLPDHGASECTDNALFPTLDVLLAAGAGIQTFRVTYANNGQANFVPASVLWLAAAVIGLASAVGGAVAESRCSDVQAEQADQPQLIRPRHRPRPPPLPIARPAAPSASPVEGSDVRPE